MAYGEQSASIYLSAKSVVITQGLIEQFLNSLEISGRQTLTIRLYRHYLQELYAFLPQGKALTKETLDAWIGSLKSRGSSVNTVNSKLAAVNGLLQYCGAEALHISYEWAARETDLRELTRPEFHELLSAASRMGKEREYYLIKIFGGIGLNISELHYLTVESVRKGVIRLPYGKEKPVTGSLKNELLSYADHMGIKEGCLFVTRNGRPLDRSNITNAFRRIAKEAGLEPERCNPRALKRMYQTTQNETIENLQPFYPRSCDDLFNTERITVRQRSSVG